MFLSLSAACVFLAALNKYNYTVISVIRLLECLLIDTARLESTWDLVVILEGRPVLFLHLTCVVLWLCGRSCWVMVCVHVEWQPVFMLSDGVGSCWVTVCVHVEWWCDVRHAVEQCSCWWTVCVHAEGQSVFMLSDCVHADVTMFVGEFTVLLSLLY